MSIDNVDYHSNRIKYASLNYANPTLLPHRYVFILTNRCNLRCSFCFQEKGPIEGSLQTDDWLKVVEQLPPYAHVTMTGGEPLLFKGFRDVFIAVTDKFSCNVISNGVLLNEDIIELLLSRPNFKVLSISVDDIGNKIRGVSQDKWRKTENMIRHFAKRRNELQSKAVLDTKTVVLDENVPDLYDIHRYCVSELQADTHTFMLLKGSPIQHADYMFPFDDMYVESAAHEYQKFPEMLEQFEKVRLFNAVTNKKCFTHPKVADLNGSVPIAQYKLDYINKSKFEKTCFGPCKSPWESVHINVDGNLFPCMAISMGNVKQQPLKDIIFGETFTKFKNILREEGTVHGCNRCGYLLPKKELYPDGIEL